MAEDVLGWRDLANFLIKNIKLYNVGNYEKWILEVNATTCDK